MAAGRREPTKLETIAEWNERRKEKQGDMHQLLTTLCQVLIISLGAVQDYLGVPRSIIPKHVTQTT